MNLGFSSLAGAWLFCLLGPLVLFYFLKLRRPRRRVPSLALWRQVLDDNRVNSPFQRFKRNLLLLLQILLLVCLVLAAMQPFWRTGPGQADRVLVLVDCSASMGALDRPRGKPRLEEAKRRVAERIDNLVKGHELSLIAFGQRARKLCPFTSNRRVLHEALDTIETEDMPSSLHEALRMAQSLDRTVPFGRVVLYSDGNLPARVDFDLPFELAYERLPAAGANLGITALRAVHRPPDEWAVFTALEASTDGGNAATLELWVDGTRADEQLVSAARGESERVAFTVGGEATSFVEVRLRPDGFDSLAADNTAFLRLPKLRPLTISVSDTLPAFRHALNGVSGVRLLAPGGTPEGTARDVVISDSIEDPATPCAALLSVGIPPADANASLSVVDDRTAVVDWRRNAPLLRHVDLTDLVVLDCPSYVGGATAGDLEQKGYEVLVHGTRGPLVLRHDTAGHIAYHLLFHSDRSTLTYRVGFPIMMANLVELVRMRLGIQDVTAARTGALHPGGLHRDMRYHVSGPGGISTDAKTDADGVLRGIMACRAGRYEIGNGEQRPVMAGASLLSGAETRLDRVDEIAFRELSARAGVTPIRNDRVLWPAVTLLALALLLVEWWFFQRGPRLARMCVR